jgi:hypothetical protein
VSQRGKLLLVVALLSSGACDRGALDGDGPSLSARRRPEVDDAKRQIDAESPGRTAIVAHLAQSTSTHTGVPDADDSGDSTSSAGGDPVLIGEERERDPGSDTVKIKVLGAEKRQAHVLWGRKDFGVAPLEIERPRNSGPLDLVVIAPGYLPYHARAFTDRDDIISFRLYSAAEAPQLLGYRASEVPPPSPAPGPAPSPAPSPAPKATAKPSTNSGKTSRGHLPGTERRPSGDRAGTKPVNQNSLENPPKSASPATAKSTLPSQ